MTSFLPSLLATNAILPPVASIWDIPSALIPIAGMAFVLGIILIGSLEKAQKEKLRHETIRQALEKGQTLPAELFEGDKFQRELVQRALDNGRPHPRDDRRTGLILLAVGIGVVGFSLAMHESRPEVPTGVAWLGCIPALIGVALLINWALERGGKNDQPRS